MKGNPNIETLIQKAVKCGASNPVQALVFLDDAIALSEKYVLPGKAEPGLAAKIAG